MIDCTDMSHQKHGPDSDALLCQLGKSGYSRFLQSVIIAADTGMNGRKGDGERHNREKQGTPGFQKDGGCQKGWKCPDQSHQYQGKNHGNRQTGSKESFSLLRISGCQPGNGSLNRAGTERKGNAVDRENHLINAESFRADGAGQEDAVKKTEETAQEAGSSQKKGSGNHRILLCRKNFHGKLRKMLSRNYMLKRRKDMQKEKRTGEERRKKLQRAGMDPEERPHRECGNIAVINVFTMSGGNDIMAVKQSGKFAHKTLEE